MSTQTNTPETDARATEREVRNLNSLSVVETVSADFARQLERQRDEARAALAQSEAGAAAMREAILQVKQDCIECAQYDMSDDAVIKCAKALESTAGTDLLAQLSTAREEADALAKALEEARKARDLAEAKARWIEDVKACETVSELACKLPPDILMAPMPFPDRLDYAGKMIQAAFDQWLANRRGK